VSQRTILFLIADTGAGHRSAANAIRSAISFIAQQRRDEWEARFVSGHEASGDQSPQKGNHETINISTPLQVAQGEQISPEPDTYHIEIVDVFDQYSRFPLREAVKLYGPAIRYNPKLYGQVFHLSNQVRRVLAVKTMATPLIHNGLLRLITTVQPDVIVSIHPMLNHVTIEALQDLGLSIPFITVVTDLVSIHHSWFAAGASSYIVPTEQAKQLYLKRGLDPTRVHVLGMPIDPKFTLPVASKEELRRKFELQPGLPVVLLVGGGEGSGGLQAAVRAISQARLPVQLLIVTGRNKRLYVHLQGTRSHLHAPAKVFGFVQNMPELMHASDVIITKAGPGTICEALACGLPLILNSYVPGQEEGNVDYVLSNGVGVLAHDSAELVDALRRLVKPGSQIMRRQVENAKRISRPNTSFDIANHILGYLPPPGKPGIWQTTRARTRSRMMSGRLRSAVRIRALRPRLPRLSSFGRPVARRLSHLRFQVRDANRNHKI
jgi:1,2-diacylglycerol 3-beta-galactosyltransferase